MICEMTSFGRSCCEVKATQLIWSPLSLKGPSHYCDYHSKALELHFGGIVLTAGATEWFERIKPSIINKEDHPHHYHDVMISVMKNLVNFAGDSCIFKVAIMDGEVWLGCHLFVYKLGNYNDVREKFPDLLMDPYGNVIPNQMSSED